MQKTSQDTETLYKGILKIKNLKEAKAFFRDLLTLQEINTFSSRFKIARLLQKNLPYTQIAKQTNTSTTTVTRVAYWLNNQPYGYKTILKQLS